VIIIRDTPAADPSTDVSAPDAPTSPAGDLPVLLPSSIDVEATYLELAPAVLGYLRTQSTPDAEDLLGEVFVQVVRDLPAFRGSTVDLRRWVFTIAHHRVVDEARRQRRRLATEPLDAPGAPEPASRAVEDPDPALLDALRTLTDDQREVIVLRFVADLPIRDVARITRRRLGAVKAMQHRALARLAEILGE
jgi:RNA polymerase sigma-70 factor (ECF subfamily)